mmetsp:Transcript_16679/g.51535  ORF Transcript_16679/g.51535 Transcript_16679/m.51535 type:complete len:213 (+) Transcript_16679:278-916(+)
MAPRSPSPSRASGRPCRSWRGDWGSPLARPGTRLWQRRRRLSVTPCSGRQTLLAPFRTAGLRPRLQKRGPCRRTRLLGHHWRKQSRGSRPPRLLQAVVRTPESQMCVTRRRHSFSSPGSEGWWMTTAVATVLPRYATCLMLPAAACGRRVSTLAPGAGRLRLHFSVFSAALHHTCCCHLKGVAGGALTAPSCARTRLIAPFVLSPTAPRQSL